MDYASRIYEIAKNEIAEQFDVQLGNLDEMSIADRFALGHRISMTPSSQALIIALTNYCKADMLEYELGDVANNWPLRLALLIRLHRFDAQISGDYAHHLCLAEAYTECSTVDCRTVRGHINNMVLDGLLVMDKSPTDARKTMLVPCGDLMYGYMTTKVCTWMHQIALNKESGLLLQSNQWRDFVLTLGFSQQGCDRGQQAYDDCHPAKVIKVSKKAA